MAGEALVSWSLGVRPVRTSPHVVGNGRDGTAAPPARRMAYLRTRTRGPTAPRRPTRRRQAAPLPISAALGGPPAACARVPERRVPPLRPAPTEPTPPSLLLTDPVAVAAAACKSSPRRLAPFATNLAEADSGQPRALPNGRPRSAQRQLARGTVIASGWAAEAYVPQFGRKPRPWGPWPSPERVPHRREEGVNRLRKRQTSRGASFCGVLN